jgi:hypothetical protein
VITLKKVISARFKVQLFDELLSYQFCSFHPVNIGERPAYS